MRLSVLYREPLHRVMQWPARDIVLLAAYLRREPTPEERLEYAVAQFTALVHNQHFKPKRELSDFLLFRKAWPLPAGRYSDVDKSFLEALG